MRSVRNWKCLGVSELRSHPNVYRGQFQRLSKPIRTVCESQANSNALNAKSRWIEQNPEMKPSDSLHQIYNYILIACYRIHGTMLKYVRFGALCNVRDVSADSVAENLF
jgi:hypothetical protein